MIKFAILLTAVVSIFSSCHSTRKLHTAIAPRDTTAVVAVIPPSDDVHRDSLNFIKQSYQGIQKNHLDFKTFSAKIKVDYQDEDGKNNNVTANLRMQKDSVIWILISGAFGFEGIRAYITPDSVKLLDKQNSIYTARSVAYLQDVTALPLTLSSLQDLFLGNPVFLDSNIVSYSQKDDAVALLSIGSFFKNLVSIGNTDYLIRSSKLDDQDPLRNRTCYLTYSDYENNNGASFSTRRHITVTEKKKIDIKLDFRQYDFNGTLSFPFSVPKNYTRN